ASGVGARGMAHAQRTRARAAARARPSVRLVFVTLGPIGPGGWVPRAVARLGSALGAGTRLAVMPPTLAHLEPSALVHAGPELVAQARAQQHELGLLLYRQHLLESREGVLGHALLLLVKLARLIDELGERRLVWLRLLQRLAD